jgi:hypothetical protein
LIRIFQVFLSGMANGKISKKNWTFWIHMTPPNSPPKLRC